VQRKISLLMTRMTTSEASEGFTASVDMVGTLEALKASPMSPTLEDETTLEAFLPKQRRWLVAGAAAPTHLYAVFLIFMRVNNDHGAPLVPPHLGAHQRCRESSQK
jgi:hypothetical protein